MNTPIYFVPKGARPDREYAQPADVLEMIARRKERTQTGPVRVYESPAYLARQRAAIVAALAAGRTAREIVGDDEGEGEEQGDDCPCL